jgi:hypothetical protein
MWTSFAHKSENWTKAYSLLSVLILATSSIYFLYIWLGYSEAWFSPLVVRGAAFIWTPDTQNIGQLLRKSLDWAALDTPDPTKWWEFKPAQRVRPLSDFSQVIDAIARPWISKFYPHPSLTPSALVAGIFTPLFFYLFVRRVCNSRIAAALLTTLLISSMGFLSVIVPDIHASAKRLSILLICISLYLSVSHDNRKFLLSVAVLLLSLFTDEMALGLYVAFVIVYASSPFATRARVLVVLGLPLLYLAVTVWGLPALYSMADDGMPTFGAIGDKRKLALLLHLADPTFYRLALSQTARAVLTTVGVTQHNFFTVALALAVLVGGSAWFAWRGHRQVAASAAALLLNGFYLTLIDLYNPEDFYSQVPTYADYNIALASYAYYYHSSLGILTLLWLVFVCRALVQYERALMLAAPLAAVIVALNFIAFHNVNQLVMMVHYYPFQVSSLYDKIREIREAPEKSAGTVIPISLQNNCSAVTRQFTNIFAASMGDTWNTNPLNRYFRKGAFTNADVGHLFYAHFPQYKFDIRVANDGDCGVPSVAVSPGGGPPGSSVLVSGRGFQAHVEVYFLWDSGGGAQLGRTIADSNGDFTYIPLHVPLGTDGTHNILASSYTGIAKSPFNITAQEASARP